MTVSQWTRFGNKVAVESYSFETDSPIIYSLTTEGILEPLTDLSSDQWESFAFRYMRWSPEARFLHYSLKFAPGEGPGYVLDTKTSEIRSICDQDSSTVFINGAWIADANLLAYTIRLLSGVTELRVLDVENWQVQRLAVTTSSEVQIKIVGWTPLELP